MRGETLFKGRCAHADGGDGLSRAGWGGGREVCVEELEMVGFERVLARLKSRAREALTQLIDKDDWEHFTP